jgi:hypothetical protein
MRSMIIAALLALSASIVTSAQASGIGMGVLMIWPTARSTAVAGAMTGLADEVDATYFNPAGLAFQTTAKADITYANWLPGLYPGLYYASAAGGAPLRLPFLRGRNPLIAGSLTYMTVGETDIVDERGEYLGRFNVWRGAAGAYAAVPLTSTLGVGVGLKLARSVHATLDDDWMWELEPATDPEPAVTATAVSADVGALYRPSRHLGFGVTVTNVGPKIHYRLDGTQNIGYAASLPRTARLGLCWTPIESRNVRLRVMPELTKVLVGMFSDTTGKSFSRQLGEEWKDVWKAIGIEATAFDFMSLRLGYFEDLTNQRGGLVYEKEWWNTEHHGIGDVLAGRHLGKLKSVGLCWGMGFGSDELRVDFSSDAAIYDFPTSNWKLQLVSNDIGGLIQRLRGN